MEEILNKEIELEDKIERMDDESKSILKHDGVGSEVLDNIKEFFSTVLEISNISAKKKQEL